jgi:hypothetical protein
MPSAETASLMDGYSGDELDNCGSGTGGSSVDSRVSTHGKHTNGWTRELERLLISWAEKASGYAWLHNQSIALYKYRNLWLTIPAAFFAYTSASTTLLVNNNDNDGVTWQQVVAGLGSLFAGMLINFQELFTFKELSEQHRLSKLGFLAFFRDISCELSIPKAQRKEANEYVTMKRLEMDKLLEHAPDIPPRLVDKFDTLFAGVQMHKPDVVSRLQTIVPHISPLPGEHRSQRHYIPHNNPAHLGPHGYEVDNEDRRADSKRRPLKLQFNTEQDMTLPWASARRNGSGGGEVSELVEIANSESNSETEAAPDAYPSVPDAVESSLDGSESGDGTGNEREPKRRRAAAGSANDRRSSRVGIV